MSQHPPGPAPAAPLKYAVSTVALPEVILDLRELPNPEPILRLAEAIESWPRGRTICVLADDRCFANDFLRWSHGHELNVVSLRYLANGDTELRLRRGGALPVT